MHIKKNGQIYDKVILQLFATATFLRSGQNRSSAFAQREPQCAGAEVT